MDKILLPREDNELIENLCRKGLGVEKGPKWWIARLALARSLQMTTPPGDEFDATGSGKGAELHMEQVTGFQQGEDRDVTDAIRMLMTTYHNEDLFESDGRFQTLLRRHIRRGLSEFRASWRRNSDFLDYLYQEMFFSRAPEAESGPEGTRGDRIAAALGEIGVRAEVIRFVEGPRITRYTLRLADVDDYERLRKGLAKLEFLLNQSNLTLQPGEAEKQVAIDVPRAAESWRFVAIPDFRQLRRRATGALPVCPGVDVLGNPFTFDLAETPHLFVGGTTGSGKSVCLHTLIISLLRGAGACELMLIDPKRVEFASYEKLNGLWGGRVLYEIDEIVAALRELLHEMETRQEELAGLHMTNIAEAQAAGSKMRRIVVFIEELADIFMQSDEAMEFTVRLAQKARAAGIHMVLATQRPDAETFPGLLRSNIPSRLALKVRTATESRIILDEIGAERLLGKGDMILRLIGDTSRRLHGFKVDAADISAAVSETLPRAKRR